jgi:hypothetical protein
MSDTPRTDAEAFWPHDSKEKVCDAVFARQLEGELNAANERIKRLEEALDEVYHAGRVGANLRAEKAWFKAKEAKP